MVLTPHYIKLIAYNRDMFSKFTNFKTYLALFVLTQLLFFVLWLVLWLGGINTLGLQSEDVVPATLQPLSLINDKSLFLDSYYLQMIDRYPHPDDQDYTKGLTPFYLKKLTLNGMEHYITAFTYVPGLLGVPVYLVFASFVTFNWFTLIIISHLTSSLIMGITSLLFYKLVADNFALTKRQTLLVTLIFAFGSINFAMFSQALWQHGVVELFTICALISIFKYHTQQSPRWLFFAGVFMSVAFVTRPTALLIIFYLTLLMVSFFTSFKRFLVNFGYYFVGLVVPLLILIYINKNMGISIHNNGYASQLLSWYSKFPEGFIGMWLSPSKGILVYSPIFIFSLLGLWQATTNKGWAKRENFKFIVCGFIIISHTLILSIWKHWYGGYSFGYRMAGEIIPFLVLLIIPYIKSTYFEKTKKLFIILLIFSICVQVFGMIFFDSIWHAAYDKGYVNTSWLWSLKDSEFAFNIRRVMVKFGLIERACPQCLPNTL